MNTSNIIGGSNIYPCKGNPLRDQNFVNQIEDYVHLQKIYKTQRVGIVGIQFTKKQMQLLEIEMRCVYAKDDPCWGYINGKGIGCKCIEDRCPQIKNCNPTYSLEQKKEWTMDNVSKKIYGYPDDQRKYYLVDLVSDEEMSRYISEPHGEAMEHSVLIDFQEEEQKQAQGRRLVIIGFEDTYFGDADNQLSPIWGYVDDSEDTGVMVRSRYGSTKEVIKSNTEKHFETSKICVANEDKTKEISVAKDVEETSKQVLDKEKCKLYQNNLKNKLGDTYQLTELNEKLVSQFSDETVLNIVLANEAEMAYVSSMLIKADIDHNIEKITSKESVILWNSNSKEIELNDERTFVSSTFIEQECNFDNEKAWEQLLKPSCINELSVTGREFFEFNDTNNVKRWGCRNLYGATHLSLRATDLDLETSISSTEEIVLLKDVNEYIIVSSRAEQLGTSTNNLWQALQSLKENDEISEFPRLISGIYVTRTESGLEIKGIGHMKFDEY